jgi:hypothetical protein
MNYNLDIKSTKEIKFGFESMFPTQPSVRTVQLQKKNFRSKDQSPTKASSNLRMEKFDSDDEEIALSSKLEDSFNVDQLFDASNQETNKPRSKFSIGFESKFDEASSSSKRGKKVGSFFKDLAKKSTKKSFF